MKKIYVQVTRIRNGMGFEQPITSLTTIVGQPKKKVNTNPVDELAKKLLKLSASEEDVVRGIREKFPNMTESAARMVIAEVKDPNRKGLNPKGFKQNGWAETDIMPQLPSDRKRTKEPGYTEDLKNADEFKPGDLVVGRDMGKIVIGKIELKEHGDYYKVRGMDKKPYLIYQGDLKKRTDNSRDKKENVGTWEGFKVGDKPQVFVDGDWEDGYTLSEIIDARHAKVTRFDGYKMTIKPQQVNPQYTWSKKNSIEAEEDLKSSNSTKMGKAWSEIYEPKPKFKVGDHVIVDGQGYGKDRRGVVTKVKQAKSAVYCFVSCNGKPAYEVDQTLLKLDASRNDSGFTKDLAVAERRGASADKKENSSFKVGDQVEITYKPEKGQTGRIVKIEGNKYYLKENPGDPKGGAWYYAKDLKMQNTDRLKPTDVQSEVNSKKR